MSGLYLYTSNRLERLAEKLAAVLRTPPLPPLQQEIIVVQSRGMEHWLCLEIAKHNGICANIAFPFPRTFSYQLFSVVAAVSNASLFSPEVMTFRIMKHLPRLVTVPEFKPLHDYLSGESAEVKLFQVSEKIAEVFDQYLVYRPDMIRAWDQGVHYPVPPSPHAAWQMLLWHQLAADSSAASLHPATLKETFIENVNQESVRTALPPRVSIFGISTLPPYYLEIFMALAQVIDVHVFYLNPCQEYWKYCYTKKQIERFTRDGMSEQDGYYEEGNSLLASLGVSGREFFSLLDTMTEGANEDAFQDPGTATMLACLQSDILHLEERRLPQSPSDQVPPPDQSIQIHCCHSPLREVEVLHDNLLALFEADRSLRPQDIVVMTPDITVYAPLVQAVFDSPAHPSQHIPYSITDMSLAMESGIASVLLAILRIDRERFRASAVLDILAHPAVRERFELSESDVPLIRQWINEAGICWGIDAAYRERLGLPGIQENTWRFGLDRLLLGYSMPEQEGALYCGIRPCGDAEGDASRVLGSLITFVETLSACNQQLEQPRTAQAWADELSDLIDRFFIVQEATERDIAEIRSMLTDEGLRGAAAAAGFDDLLSRDVVCMYLEGKFKARIRHRGFLSSGVTFCTMLPMRSIPFRLVYLLGMNDGQYPRTEQRPGFDLMVEQRRLCDRSKRHEDRFLFLEALLSARQYFIISYVGRSIKDNSRIPPSVVVCELEDYIRQGFGEAVLEQMITEHPLQPFSIRYFSGNPKLFTYSEHNYNAATAAAGTRLRSPLLFTDPLPAPPPDLWQTVTCDQLCSFFRNPCEFLLRERLATTLRLAETPEPKDRESFELDFLEQYYLRQEILGACLHGNDPKRIFEYVKASGKLPPGSAAAAAYTVLARDVADFFENVKTVINNEPEMRREIAIELPQPRLTLIGTMRSLFGGKQVLFRCARRSARDLLRAWIQHVVLQAAGLHVTTTYLDRDGAVSYPAVEDKDAQRILQNLAELFIKGLMQPLPFFPLTSFAFVKTLVKKSDLNAAYKAAEKEWFPGYATSGESDDIYISACFGTELPHHELFEQSSRTVYEPLIACMQG